ncbi:hypothetical protein HALOF300_01139 [Occultella aeris]|uniref:Uncharacterized protein n=1 Tax=Occultella aeris TaxID=2761496 RepID=A0A7M4DG93_9MICO|nr:hypothetical protein HALOF300_01139 [Occultella aeris]
MAEIGAACQSLLVPLSAGPPKGGQVRLHENDPVIDPAAGRSEMTEAQHSAGLTG